MNAYGYIRVSTEEQAESGHGLDAQTRQIEAAALARGLTLKGILPEHASGKNVTGRGVLQELLMKLDDDGGTLIVAKLDRLSRSVGDFAGMLERSRKNGWSIVALDLGVDTSTPTGELVANVMISVAQWERRIIGQRTKEALAQARDNGVQLGRPKLIGEDAVRRVLELWRKGETMRGIALQLEHEGIPTPTGRGRWRPSVIYAIVKNVPQVPR